MQAATLPLSYGWVWVREGMLLFKRQPMAMFFWSLVTNMLINLSYLVPLLGQMALISATPLLTFIALNACHRIAKGETIPLNAWLKPIKPVEVRRPLIRLGLLYMLVCLAGGIVATLPFMEGIINAIPQEGQVEESEILALMRAPMLTFTGLYILISALFWHAPALVGWHHIPIKKALFYSMVACWRNKLPFIVYGICWAALYYLMHQLGHLLLSLGFSVASIQLLTTPITLALMAILYCSFYPIYLSVFGASAMARREQANVLDADE
ncbi:BPSS1780 family membrane protein [Paenalcaligenes niemegkensis]|uniref:BPSS1780 family membrane protein n=1 Tax=Paenalcaligenes niemegkensis TaxID=2895469 RepID=UPI0021516601|nr:BPSS1780 family membrane protein [Paenalcaligenes niemegkensis]MCQ9616212.1 BPSS1780 family membrane protein [Paenalcaligenes niemegkensis]